MSDKKTILFVCTGNSCRSVMAAGLLKDYLERSERLDINVVSAGTRTIDNTPPTEFTVEVMKREGIDVSGHRTMMLTDLMIKSSSLILVMERHHKEEILRRDPSAAKKTFLLREFERRPSDSDISADGIDVLDPIGRPIEDYERVLKTIKEEIERISEFL